MNYFFTLLLVIILPSALFAQKEGSHWIFSYGTHLKFSSDTIIRLPDIPNLDIQEASSPLSDANGNLIFTASGSCGGGANPRFSADFAIQITTPPGLPVYPTLRGHGTSSYGVCAFFDRTTPKRYYVATTGPLTGGCYRLLANSSPGLYISTVVEGPSFALDSITLYPQRDTVNRSKLPDGTVIPNSEALAVTGTCDGKGHWVVSR